MPWPKGKPTWNKGLKGAQTAWNKGKKCIQLSGQKNHQWSGGRCERGDGYIEIYQPNHRLVLSRKAKKLRPYVFEHILVAEMKIGRPLRQNEVVHHINEIKNDNRPENLAVITRSEHIREHKPRKLINKWAYSGATNCVDCKRSDNKHYAKDRCRNCFNRKFRKSRAKAFKEVCGSLSLGKCHVSVQEIQ